MNILITGSSGYIGIPLCQLLVSLNHNIIEYDIKNNRLNDIQNTSRLESMILKNNIDVLIHLAAARNIDNCENNISKCIEINLLSTISLYNVCEKHGVKFIFASTRAVIDPVNHYSVCKSLAEKYIPNAVILRLSNVVGGYEGMLKHQFPNLTDNIISHACNNSPLYLYGNCQRNFVFINSVVIKFSDALLFNAGVFDVLGKIDTDMETWISHWQAYLDCNIEIVRLTTKEHDALNLSNNNQFDEDYFKEIALSYKLLSSTDYIEVAGIKIPKSKMTIDNERYTIYENQIEGVVNSITVLKPKQSTRGHKHKHWESYYFDKTGGTLYLNGFGIDITKEQKIEIPPNMHHKVINDTDSSVAFLCQWVASDVEKGYQ